MTHSYQRFFAELKRRKVFRVAAVYGAASFAILEASDILFPRVGLPEWTVTFVAVLALIGFPVALVLAWVYERTSAGLRRTVEAETGELEAIASAPAGSRWPVGLAAAAGTALLLLGSWWALGRPSPAGSTAAADSGRRVDAYQSIAVLPFANMSEDASDEYFSDGLTEELLNALARVPELKVAARTSSFAYKGENKDLREIGQSLGVETILEGSVRRAGGRVRVTAQLIDTADGFHVWSRDWDRSLTAENVFDIQDEIAGSVARALATGTAPDETYDATGDGGRTGDGIVPAGVRTSDLEAYDLYLLGRHGWASRTPEGLRSAVQYFEAALERDSLFVPAWVGLAAAYNALPWWSDYPGREGGERSKRAARRALELDPGNSEALYTLATTMYEFDRDWDEAERLFARAREIDPDYPPGLTWYGQMLESQGRPAEGLPWVRRAVAADPFSVHALNSEAGVLLTLGRWRDAIEVCNRTLDVDPEFPSCLERNAQALARLGEWESAESFARRWFVSKNWDPATELAADLMAGLRYPEERERAVRTILHLTEQAEPLGRWVAVEWLLFAGDREGALDQISLLIADRSGPPASLLNIVGVRELAGEPRFVAAAEAVGLGPYVKNLKTED